MTKTIETKEEWQKAFQKGFSEYFEEARKRNKRFSLRALAKKIKLSAGTTSELINNKPTLYISKERAAEVLKIIDINPKTRDRILILMGMSPLREKQDFPEKLYQHLTDWTYPAILFMHELPEEKRSPRSISSRLGIPEAKVKSVIQQMLQDRLLVVDEVTGTYKRNGQEIWKTADDVPVKALNQFHENSLKLSCEALQSIPVQKRDITSLTFATSKDHMLRIKKQIRSIYERALAEADHETEDVYQLSIQLFPYDFSQKEKNK